MEKDQFVCKFCERVIRYERPLFCPYCGHKIDPVDGLEPFGSEAEIYRWTKSTPLLVYLFLIWVVLVIPITWIWGRAGFAWVSGIWILGLLGVFLLGMGQGKSKNS